MSRTFLRISRRDVAVALASCIVGIISFLFTVGFIFARTGAAPIAITPVSEPISKTVVVPPDDPDAGPELEELKAQLLSAKTDLEMLQEQRTYEWEQTALLVGALLDAGDAAQPGTAGPISSTLEKLHRRFDAEADEFLGQLDELIFYAILAGLSGPGALQDIVNSINDPSADLELRQALFNLLYMVPSETSLQMILNPPKDLGFPEDADQDLGSVAMILETIPPPQATPYLPQLYEKAMGELEHSPQDDDGWSLLGVLALTHRYPPAVDVLNRPRNFELFGNKLLEMAWWIGTQESRAIIERISREHPQPELREKATEILAGW